MPSKNGAAAGKGQEIKKSDRSRAEPDFQPTAEEINSAHAANLREKSGPAFAYSLVASSISNDIAPEALVEYRRQFLKDCGDPRDPLVILLIDQVLIANFAVGRLHLKSVLTGEANSAAAYSNCAVRLMGELRRCVLALDALRSGGKTAEGNETPSGTENTSAVTRNGVEKTVVPVKLNSKPRGEIPECIKNRMAPPKSKTRNGSSLAVATG